LLADAVSMIECATQWCEETSSAFSSFCYLVEPPYTNHWWPFRGESERHRIDVHTALGKRGAEVAPRLTIVIAIKSAAQRVREIGRGDLELIGLRQAWLGRGHERQRRSPSAPRR
jgi:hypothetical protein